jgi:hypothetical protein
MSRTYITVEMRRIVIERAGNCCEYCLLSQEDNTFSFQIDHVVSEKHEGETTLANLSLSCPSCNHFKGSDIAALDHQTKAYTPFYNPRTQTWEHHFRLNEATIEPISPEGRVTARLLKFNRAEILDERRALLELGRYPCRSMNI